MSKLIIVFAILFMAGCNDTVGKYFTGTIEYAYTYTSDLLNLDSLSKARPSKGLFRYDEASYQSRFIGADTNTYYYSGKLNKTISETGIQKNYACEDYSIATDSVLSYKLNNTEEKILGYNCRVIELQKSRSFVKYYVSNEHIMSPTTYKDHRSYNWDFYGNKTGGGLILKVEHRFRNFTMHGEAKDLQIKKNNFKALEIDEKLFSQICR